MKALGLIETRGLLAAIEGADAMVKSADVSILEKTYVGGGLVSVAITGDVGAVKAAIEAGVAAVKNLEDSLLVSEHVIPRPHDELESIIGIQTKAIAQEDLNTDEEIISDDEIVEDKELVNNEELVDNTDNLEQKHDEYSEIIDELIEENPQEDTDIIDSKIDSNEIHKDIIDNLVSENGIEKAIEVLSNLKVVKLRNLAREYEDFEITGRVISKAGKSLLIEKFRKYYERD